MGKAEDAVRHSGRLQSGESILGSQPVIVTVGPGERRGGFVVQTDQAVYFCVQGGLGMGKVKEVHRLEADRVLALRARQSDLSRDGMDVMFVADEQFLTIGSPVQELNIPIPDDAQPLGSARMLAITFRTQPEYSNWSRLWKQVVPHEQMRDSGETSEVRRLQEQYANRVSCGAQMVSEMREIDQVYARLRELGADADPDLVEEEKRRNADWMRENPLLGYYEPHLDRERFDADQRRRHAPVAENDILSVPPSDTKGDPIDRYTAQQLYDAVRHSIQELNIRRPTECALEDWYRDLVKAGEGGYDTILLHPSETHSSLADELAEWLMGTAASQSGHGLDQLAWELEAWVDFDPSQGNE